MRSTHSIMRPRTAPARTCFSLECVSPPDTAAVLGLVVQGAVFLGVTAVLGPRQGFSRAVVVAGTVAIYGYALVISATSLWSMPWWVTNGLLTLGVVLALAVPRVRRALAAGLPLLGDAVRRSGGAVAIVVVVMLFHLAVAAVKPEISVDGQLYHGPALANLASRGSLWGWSATNEYVYYSDLTIAGGVNLAVFAGDARFDDALQVPHLLLLIAVINWALSHRYPSVFFRVALATLIVAAPVIWLQPRVLYVDVAYAAAVVAAVVVVVFSLRFGRLDLITGGILVGAVFATKPTGLLTGGLLLVALLAYALVRRRGARLRDTLVVVAATVGPPLAAASAFYVRNLVQFGNPVYPVSASLGPISFPGILDFSLFASGDRGNGFVDPSRLLIYLGAVADGMINGVSKLDYDPRSGGFGHVPLAILVIALGLIIWQIVARVRLRERGIASSVWRSQLALVGLAAAILLVQPSTFDTRYVIAPTVVLLIAVLLTDVGPLTRRPQIVAGTLALVLAVLQACWTERTMYPGLSSIRELSRTADVWQPPTPGNPWGTTPAMRWLNANPGDCLSVAVQTSGGVTPTGMKEPSWTGTLSYALYGSSLCNSVTPIVKGAESTERLAAVLGNADYLVLYAADAKAWVDFFPELEDCLAEVGVVKGNAAYTEEVVVLRNDCD